MAVVTEEIKIVEALLQKGVNKEITNEEGKKPIVLAKTEAIRNFLSWL
jgi:hypothetical protein